MENICKEGMPHKWFLALKVIFPVGLGKDKISCFAHLWVGCWFGNAYFRFFCLLCLSDGVALLLVHCHLEKGQNTFNFCMLLV